MNCCVFSRCEPRDILSEISSNSSQRSTSTLREDVYQQAINLLQLVKSTCGRSPIASAMFMEELAAAIHDGAIHSKVEVRYYTVLHMHTLSRTTWSKVCVTAGCPSTCLSVPSVDRSSNVQWVCCWVPCGQEIAIDSRRRHSVTPTPQAWLAWCSAVNADIVVLTAALEGPTQTCLHLFFFAVFGCLW